MQPYRMTGPEFKAVLKSFDQFSKDQPQADVENFLISIEEKADELVVSFSPKRVASKFDVAYGGSNQYGYGVNYHISKITYEILRVTYMR